MEKEISAGFSKEKTEKEVYIKEVAKKPGRKNFNRNRKNKRRG